MGKQSNRAKGARGLLNKWLKDRGKRYGRCLSNQVLRSEVIAHPECPPDLKHVLATSTNKTWKLAAIRYFERTDPDFVLAAAYKPRAKKTASDRMVSGLSVALIVSREFYETREWKAIRYRALQTHGPVCQCCGATRKDGTVIQVDHIKPKSKFPELALSLDNLQILCEPCNIGKSNIDSTDWR